jgi:hypothetical protein
MRKTIFAAAVSVGALLAPLSSAAAQDNPFVGIWSTSVVTWGGGMAVLVDFYPNGRLHLSGLVTAGGEPLHEWGTYQVDARQSVLRYVFQAYAPRKCINGYCEPGPPNINVPVVVQYSFPNPNQVIFSDGAVYVRQRSNPYPDPN